MIRWIVKDRLGTAAKESLLLSESGFLIDARSLVDKLGNSTTDLLEKIQMGVAELNRGGSVIVVCDFGISRSNAIAAGILVKWQRISLDAAVTRVIDATGESSIKLDMIHSLREALDKSTTPHDPDGILITGGGGFLGTALRSLLATTHRVFAPDRVSLDLLGPVLHLDRYCRNHGIAKIVHLAYPRVYTNNEALGQSLTMLRGVLDVCKSQGIQLILPSSWVVFSGYRTQFMEADIRCAARPRGVYGEAKFLEEMLVKNAADNGEVAATIIRLSPIYGASSLRPRLIRFAHQYLLEDRSIVTHRYRNGLPKLQLLYVDDAVAGLADIVRVGRMPMYHLGGINALEPREIITTIGDILGRRAKLEEVTIDDHAANVFLDFSATESELGWRPAIGVREGLGRTLTHNAH